MRLRRPVHRSSYAGGPLIWPMPGEAPDTQAANERLLRGDCPPAVRAVPRHAISTRLSTPLQHSYCQTSCLKTASSPDQRKMIISKISSIVRHHCQSSYSTGTVLSTKYQISCMSSVSSASSKLLPWTPPEVLFAHPQTAFIASAHVSYSGSAGHSSPAGPCQQTA